MTKSMDSTLFIKTPLKGNTSTWHSSTGRNNKGRITAWQRGGRHARSYRHVDFTRKETEGIVIGLEYDPYRSAFLARVFNPDTKKHHYILASTKTEKGQTIRSDSYRNSPQTAHSGQLRYMPMGSFVYNLSLKPGDKGKMLRAPGAFGRLLKREEGLALVCFKTDRYRWFHDDTIATLGIVSNRESHLTKLRKAGQSRWIGKRPTVRGVAMNPIDHPHGGGEGKTSGGRPSVTPWAKPTRGIKTRKIRKQLKPYDKICLENTLHR